MLRIFNFCCALRTTRLVKLVSGEKNSRQGGQEKVSWEGHSDTGRRDTSNASQCVEFVTGCEITWRVIEVWGLLVKIMGVNQLIILSTLLKRKNID